MRTTSDDGSGVDDLHTGGIGIAHIDIKRNDAQRLMLINDIPVQFSPLEYQVMLTLTAHIGMPVSFETLTHAASWPGEAPCSRPALERHIDRIRQKLRVCNVEVRGVSGYGCVLLTSCHEKP